MLRLSRKLIFVLLSIHKPELKSRVFLYKEERHHRVIYRPCIGPGLLSSAGDRPPVS